MEVWAEMESKKLKKWEKQTQTGGRKQKNVSDKSWKKLTKCFMYREIIEHKTCKWLRSKLSSRQESRIR
jgi:hypothetical protein